MAWPWHSIVITELSWWMGWPFNCRARLYYFLHFLSAHYILSKTPLILFTLHIRSYHTSISSILNNFHSLEVVDRVSETQLQWHNLAFNPLRVGTFFINYFFRRQNLMSKEIIYKDDRGRKLSVVRATPNNRMSHGSHQKKISPEVNVHSCSASTRRSPNVGVMLGRRRTR